MGQDDDEACLPGLFMAELVSGAKVRELTATRRAVVHCTHPVRALLTAWAQPNWEIPDMGKMGAILNALSASSYRWLSNPDAPPYQG